MNTLNLNLQKLMAIWEINESELARQTGVHQSVINRLASGNTANPNINSLRPIAQFFSITLDQLVGDEPLDTELGLQGVSKAHAHWTNIPIIEWDFIDARLNNSNALNPSKIIAIDKELDKKSFALVVADPTMQPRFPLNALLIIDVGIQAKNRDYILVQYKDKKNITVKQLLIDEEIYYLKPLDPDFKTTTMTEDHKILGVIVQCRMDFYNEC